MFCPNKFGERYYFSLDKEQAPVKITLVGKNRASADYVVVIDKNTYAKKCTSPLSFSK